VSNNELELDKNYTQQNLVNKKVFSFFNNINNHTAFSASITHDF